VVEGYLIYRVDEGLSVVPMQTFYCLDFVAVREDFRDKRDPVIRTERALNQTFPCWDAAVCEDLVKPTARFQG
jgi:hypothetical protein